MDTRNLREMADEDIGVPSDDELETHDEKSFNDPIHGTIKLHPLCIKIIDTPQFQRLRNIKQLGTCYLVYPGASHNRFEHSLGVCHLAGKLLRNIKERQPKDVTTGAELITEKDILCVEIAGLCHDLGHGPFSHLFEKFIQKVCPNETWKHEKASVDMFDHILDDNDGHIRDEFKRLMPDFEKNDLIFIKELIDVPVQLENNTWPYKGRGEEKSFLYEVVANKTNGIDVDKWDYLARDCYTLGMKNSFDYNRCISSARVLTVGGRKQICYRDKQAYELYDMFYVRLTFHRRAYQHKTHNVIAIMMCDALVEADEFLHFEGNDGKRLRMSEAINDMVAYTKLTDLVTGTILRSTDDNLKESRRILSEIIERKLYKIVAQKQTKLSTKVDTDTIKNYVVEYVKKKYGSKIDVDLRPSDFEVDVPNVGFGMKEQDPIRNVWFYTKNKINEAVQMDKKEVSTFLPEIFAEQIIRLYCKRYDQTLIKLSKEAFSAWCEENIRSGRSSIQDNSNLR